jgi:transcription antitermination factor NusG
MNSIISSIDIKENDKVRIIDGCFRGREGKVRLVRPENHYPYLVSLPGQDLIPYMDGQIEKK